MLVAREVEDRARDDDIHRAVLQRNCLHGLDAETIGLEPRRDAHRELPHAGNHLRTLIHAPHLEPGAHEKHEVTSRATTCVENLHALRDAAAQELIEQVDVDVAELLAQVCRRLRHAGAAICASSASHSASPAASPIALRMSRLSRSNPTAIVSSPVARAAAASNARHSASP